MKIGKYAVVEPIEYKFEKEPDLFWRIKPPTSRGELEMSRFLHAGRETGGRVVPISWLELAHREIALTFAGTNIENENGKPILLENASVDRIEGVLADLPHEMVMEIWGAIGEHVPGWGPKNPESRP